MSDIRPEPEDWGAPLASQAGIPFEQQLGAEWGSMVHSGPVAGILREARRGIAGGDFLDVGRNEDVDTFGTDQDRADQRTQIEAQRAAIPDTPIEQARARIKQDGLEGILKLPDQPAIKTPVLDLLIGDAHDRRDRDAAIARGPDSFIPNAIGFTTSMGVGMLDPLNVAAFSIPMLREARVASLIARAGESIAARAAVKFGVGAVQGAVGTAALQPLDWWIHTRDGADYTMAEALQSVVMGAGMGGAFHAGFGTFGDVRAKLRGRPLEGSPQDLLERGLTAAPPSHFDIDEPVDDAVPGVEPSPPIVPERSPAERSLHPAEVLADLPEAAREDAFHAAVAGTVDGRPVQTAEMLRIAADHDPRVAQAFEPERIRSATIEHDGRVYEGANHADAIEKLETERGGRLDDISDQALSAGFMTTKGRRVGREEALDIAQRQGQHDPENVVRLPNDAPSNVKGLVAEETNMAPTEQSGNPKITLGADLGPAPPPHPPEPDGEAADPLPADRRPLPTDDRPIAAAPVRDLATAASDPRWRELADTRPDFDEPDVLEESRAADHVEEPASVQAPERALSAIEQEAARAEEIWKQIEPTLTEKERAIVNDVLDQLKLDKEARDRIITDGAACLVAAIA